MKFTDEANFLRDGIVNLHKKHIWSEKIHIAFFQVRRLQLFKITIRVRIIGECLLGPHILPPTLNGIVYRDFLTNDFPNIVARCTPCKKAKCTLYELQLHYTLLWIGRGGPVARPPRSSDVNPTAFSVWGCEVASLFKTPLLPSEIRREYLKEYGNHLSGELLTHAFVSNDSNRALNLNVLSF